PTLGKLVIMKRVLPLVHRPYRLLKMPLDRFVVWIGMLVKRFRQHHDEAGRAMAASEGACLSKGFLRTARATGPASSAGSIRPTQTRRAGAERVLRLTMMARRVAGGSAAVPRAPEAGAAKVIAPP